MVKPAAVIFVLNNLVLSDTFFSDLSHSLTDQTPGGKCAKIDEKTSY